MNPLYSEIGARVKEIRKDFNLTQSQFSQLLDIRTSHCSMIERGIIPINPLEMESIYKQFQVSVNWLITGDGEKRKNKFISDDEDVQKLETFLMKFPWFMKELKSSLKKFYKENKESLDEKTKAFLIEFTGQEKNETIS